MKKIIVNVVMVIMFMAIMAGCLRIGFTYGVEEGIERANDAKLESLYEMEPSEIMGRKIVHGDSEWTIRRVK
jgi:hypothetical protein